MDDHQPDSGASLAPFRTIYRFGNLDDGHYGHVVLRPEGGIGYYRHDNEAGYRLEGDRLNLISADGAITSRLRYHDAANCFLPVAPHRLYLLPALELGPAPQAASLPPVFINSIPKSGTYFLEAALHALGMTPLGLHLLPHRCDDYRGVPPELMHREPERYAVPVPPGAVAYLLRPGEAAVGHVDNPYELDHFAAAGVCVLNCVRDLRDVLVSLYHFKRDRVASTGPGDTLWRALPPGEGFAAFLCHYADRDIAHIRSMAATLLARPAPLLHYDELRHGNLPGTVPLPGLAAALQEVRDKPTSTFSHRDHDRTALWSEAAARFFHDFGLAALNERLGYAPVSPAPEEHPALR